MSKPTKFQSLSLNLGKRPLSAAQNSENPRVSSRNLCEISCLMQKCLENLLLRENFFKSPALTRISQRERSQKLAQTSMKLRVSNKSAEYQEVSLQKDLKLAGSHNNYEKFKEKFESSVKNSAGLFVYARNIRERRAFLQKVQKNAENLRENSEKAAISAENQDKLLRNRGKLSIISELKEKSLVILEETLGFRREKQENDVYKREIARNLHEMCEINEKLQEEKYFL